MPEPTQEEMQKFMELLKQMREDNKRWIEELINDNKIRAEEIMKDSRKQKEETNEKIENKIDSIKEDTGCGSCLLYTSRCV